MSADRHGARGWRLTLTLSRAAFQTLEDALARHAEAVVAQTVAEAHPERDVPEDTLRVTLFGAGPAADDPRPAQVQALLREAGVETEAAAPEPLAAADWAARSRESFPPLSVGRFTVVGAHEAATARRFALRVDAGTAFGSGRHETTQGCLLALERLARRRRVRVAFDVGTGSGILALAAARLWPARVVAVDNDPAALAAARATLRQNALGRRVTLLRGTGLRVAPAARLGRADLIVANIRARPIAAMAPAFARHLGAGGALVLSGLVAREERFVLAAFRAARFRLRRRFSLGSWVTLILTR